MRWLKLFLPAGVYINIPNGFELVRIEMDLGRFDGFIFVPSDIIWNTQKKMYGFIARTSRSNLGLFWGISFVISAENPIIWFACNYRLATEKMARFQIINSNHGLSEKLMLVNKTYYFCKNSLHFRCIFSTFCIEFTTLSSCSSFVLFNMRN